LFIRCTENKQNRGPETVKWSKDYFHYKHIKRNAVITLQKSTVSDTQCSLCTSRNQHCTHVDPAAV